MARPPGVPNRDGGSRWLLACGVGCGALLLIVVLAIIASVTAIRYGMGEAVGEMRTGFVREYERLQEDEKIPPEHAEVFDRIYVVAQEEDTSFMATMMGFFVIMAYLDDGEVTETEAESAAILADYLEEHPDMGFMGFAEFVEEHPEFQDAFQDAQQNMQQWETDSDADFEEDFVDEETDSDADLEEESVAEEPESL